MLSTNSIIELLRRKLEFLKNCGLNSTILDFFALNTHIFTHISGHQ